MVCQANEQCCNGVCGNDCNAPRACAGRPVGWRAASPWEPATRLEACDGASDACPADTIATAGVACRAVTGPCDIAEVCNGASAQCPSNTLVAQGIECRAKADTCDVAEARTGVSAACPVDLYAVQGAVCAEPPPGPCDVAENCCSGSDTSRPGDAMQGSDVVCRPITGPVRRRRELQRRRSQLLVRV